MESRLTELLSDSPRQRLQTALETPSELAETEATPLATLRRKIEGLSPLSATRRTIVRCKVGQNALQNIFGGRCCFSLDSQNGRAYLNSI